LVAGSLKEPRRNTVSMGRLWKSGTHQRGLPYKFHPMFFVRSVKESIPSPEVNVYILKNKPWISKREIIYLPVIITQQLKLIHLVRWFVQLYILFK
jgi:hypothetical protein